MTSSRVWRSCARIVEHHPTLPVLMFTQYAQGPAQDTAVRGALRWNAPVDFIDKLASPEEVVLRLRRLMGSSPELIPIGAHLLVDVGGEDGIRAQGTGRRHGAGE